MIRRDGSRRRRDMKRHGNGQALDRFWSEPSLVADHGSTLAQHGHPLISLSSARTTWFSLFYQFLESYRIDTLTHSIAE